MRSDRRSARLTALWAATAIAAGVASVWIPASRGAVAPSIIELTVGWALLVASVLLARRTPSTAALLGLAGLMWIGVGLAPFAGGIGGDVLLRLALAPTALVAIAAIIGPGGRMRVGNRTILVVSVIATATVAGAGWYRYSVMVIGALTMASALAERRSTNVSSDRVRLGVGGGMLAAGTLAAGAAAVAASPQFVANLHDLVLIGATAAITTLARRERTPSHTDGIELGEPSALAESLAVALGCGPLTIAFPGPAGTWLDPSGRASTSPAPGGPVRSDSGPTIAWLSPAVHLDAESAVTVRRILQTASETATLRAELRRRAAEIGRSRERLQSSVAGEQARLVVLLESGPLAALARAGTLLTQTSSGRGLSTRLAEAERVLGDVVRGLHPVEIDGGLIAAIENLTDRSHATLLVDPKIDVDTDLDAAEREVVWFTCAEGLANATKHAPGSNVVIRLQPRHTAVVMTVSDDGPGGADVTGSGLAGLRERVEAAGGSLTVDSTVDVGTTLHLEFPTRSPGAYCHVAEGASTPIRTSIEFGTVGA